MRTYVSPIGYDTRRVTRPVVTTGLGEADTVIMLRPEAESDADRATQAIADVEQLLQEIEPGATCAVEHVSIESFEDTIHDCQRVIQDARGEVIVSLSGGARDVLLPLTVAALVHAESIDTALFFSDVDSTVRPWTLPQLTARVPERARETFRTIGSAEDWLTLSEIAERTGQSKSTVVRHVNDLEESAVVETDTTAKTKKVRSTLSGDLLMSADS